MISSLEGRRVWGLKTLRFYPYTLVCKTPVPETPNVAETGLKPVSEVRILLGVHRVDHAQPSLG